LVGRGIDKLEEPKLGYVANAHHWGCSYDQALLTPELKDIYLWLKTQNGSFIDTSQDDFFELADNSAGGLCMYLSTFMALYTAKS
jgi:hypothetical protein